MLTSTLDLAVKRAGFSSLQEFLTYKNIPEATTAEALMPYLVGYELHRVRPGDTFYKLAGEFDSSVRAIVVANPRVDPNNLQIGSVLIIPLNFSVVPQDTPITSELLNYIIRGLEARYPALSSFSMGRTAGNRNLPLLRVGQGPRIAFYNASHHANEWITTPLVMGLLEKYLQAEAFGEPLEGENVKTIAKNTSLLLAPMVNPDGVDLVLGAVTQQEQRAAEEIAQNYPEIPFPQGWKANLRGTDLNLNYPARWDQAREIKYEQGFLTPAPRDFVGPTPLSEKESRAMFDVTKEVVPDITISWHTQGQEIYWKFLNLEPEGARRLGQQMALSSGYDLSEIPYASSFAGYKDWFIQDFDRPGYTIEAGLGENPLPLDQLPQMLRDNMPIFLLGLTGGDPNWQEPVEETAALPQKQPSHTPGSGHPVRNQTPTSWG